MEDDDYPMIVDDIESSPAKADASMDMTDGFDDGNDDDNDDVEEAVVTSRGRRPTSLRVDSEDDDDDGGGATGHTGDTNHEHMILTPPSGPPFAAGDKVLCLHGSSSSKKPSSSLSSDRNKEHLLYYPAVIRKVRFVAARSPAEHEEKEEGRWEFLVHFVGWHARYDQWTPSGDLLLDTPEHRALNEARMPPPPNAAVDAAASSSSDPTTASKKRKKGLTAEKGTDEVAQGVNTERAKSHKRAAGTTETSASSRAAAHSAVLLEEYCELPLTLKTVLWDEWERLNPRDYLYHSPAAHHTHNIAGAGPTYSAGTTQEAAPPRTRLPTRVLHDLPSKASVRYVLSHFRKTATQKCREANSNQQPPMEDNKNKNMGATAPGTSAASASSSANPAQASSRSSTATPEQIQEFCNGLLQLFETALPLCLLYPQEHPQYEAMLADHRRNRDDTSDEPSSLQLASMYGCEHLLRLLVRLPALMQAGPSSSAASASLPRKEQLQWMGPLLRELILLLQKNRSQIFTKTSYRPPRAPHEYLEWERDLYGMTVNPKHS